VSDIPFEADQPRAAETVDRFVLELDGYEGPLDVLLGLAREQKVDLARISILQLAEQYLDFVQRARSLRLELAAEYLVMAAWLAYLKSKLLLPSERDGDEPSGPEMAEALQFQLRRLDALRAAVDLLTGRPQLGREVFARGEREELPRTTTVVYHATLYDLLKGYADQKKRQIGSVLQIKPSYELFSVEDALKRLEALVGRLPEWTALARFLPQGLRRGLNRRSAIAATFAASLELAKTGQIAIQQDRQFGPIYIRSEGTRP
jgi:segregation and condensation protein A